MATFWSRLWDKTKKDPLIPIGCTATLGCLSAGLYAFKSGEKHLSQKMMRARVVAQGFTVAVLMAGAFYNSNIKAIQEPARGRSPS
ncbi:hig1 domain family member 2a-like [Nannochloropsis oceanica]